MAVVDLALGADDGVDLVRWIRHDYPDVRVLVLSMQDEALYAERLLRLGVSGYVMKNVAGTDFLGALRKVARGQRHVSAAMGERLLSQVARGRAPGADEDPVSALTERELEVFRLIGEGISTREISQRLELSMKTVDAHRRHMREKLNLRSTSELIRYATQWVSDKGGAPREAVSRIAVSKSACCASASRRRHDLPQRGADNSSQAAAKDARGACPDSTLTAARGSPVH